MKQILFFVFCFTIINATAQQLTSKFTSFENIHEPNTWEVYGVDVYTYDASCNLVSDVYKYILDDGSRTDDFRWLYYYTADNKNNEQIYQYWSQGNNAWINSSRQLKEYNDKGLLKTTTFQSLVNNTWQNSKRNTTTYDETNHGIIWWQEIWSNGSWQNSAVDSSFYDNGRLSESINQIWEGSTLKIKLKTTYNYDIDGKLLNLLIVSWQTDHWENYELQTRSYTNISYYTYTNLSQTWNRTNNTWQNYILESVANSSITGDLTEFKIESWQTQNVSYPYWRKERLEEYAYASVCTLPLHWLAFNTIPKNNNVQLNWQTADEINTAFFTIERSIDGVHFNKIGSVSARPQSNLNNYTYTDDITGINASLIYYRLKLTNKDGKEEVSKIVKINKPTGQNSFVIKPNPANSYFIISPGNTDISNAVILIRDMLGNTVLQSKYNGNVSKINIQTFKPGIYFVSVQANGNTMQQKLVVQ